MGDEDQRQADTDSPDGLPKPPRPSHYLEDGEPPLPGIKRSE